MQTSGLSHAAAAKPSRPPAKRSGGSFRQEASQPLNLTSKPKGHDLGKTQSPLGLELGLHGAYRHRDVQRETTRSPQRTTLSFLGDGDVVTQAIHDAQQLLRGHGSRERDMERERMWEQRWSIRNLLAARGFLKWREVRSTSAVILRGPFPTLSQETTLRPAPPHLRTHQETHERLHGLGQGRAAEDPAGVPRHAQLLHQQDPGLQVEGHVQPGEAALLRGAGEAEPAAPGALPDYKYKPRPKRTCISNPSAAPLPSQRGSVPGRYRLSFGGEPHLSPRAAGALPAATPATLRRAEGQATPTSLPREREGERGNDLRTARGRRDGGERSEGELVLLTD
ncbi:hypothetical protein F7725_016495 [Dissostichus mawsoni]|uniref:Uncharacterized protein n=1 Tax=Dissostichus mawsoni TaxID=36200 RepID=A0A7J5Z1S4_DISMA|nr:hypothetical protein F7725_016495 [Dissostichus mawsoni]